MNKKHGKYSGEDHKPGRADHSGGGKKRFAGSEDDSGRDKKKSAGSEDRPSRDKKKSSSFEDRPGRDKKKSAGFEDRPSRDKKKFSGSEDNSAPEKKKFSGSDEKASRTGGRSARPERPARRDRGDQPGRPEKKDGRPARPRFERPAPRQFKKEPDKTRTADAGETDQLHPAGEDDRLILKGRHEVVQALESGQQLDSVVISTALKGPVGSVVRELASKAQIPVKEMNPDLFARKFGEKSQGIVAIGGTFSYCSLEEIAEKATAGRGILVALNHVEDARNLGAIVRTVEASGCSGVLIPKHRSASMTEWAVRTAQGAASYLPVARVNNIAEALEKLKEIGYWVVGLDGDAPKRYDEVVYSGRIVLVAGGEDAGLGERVRKICDDVVSIPLVGHTPSLNVSVSTAVALYEILRQKEFFKNSLKSS